MLGGSSEDSFVVEHLVCHSADTRMTDLSNYRDLDVWRRSMELVGVHFAPTLWGFAAAIAETLGGLCLALGLWTRAACLPLAFTMVMATVNHLAKGDGFGKASHAIEACFVFVGLFFIGPGRYSFDKR